MSYFIDLLNHPVVDMAVSNVTLPADPGPVTSPLRLALSGVAGSTSLACWIVLLLPQLIEQWRLKSAEGISLQFLLLWFLGDVFNLGGALWANLLPQVVFLAIWYCIADFLSLFSYFYYTKIYPKHHRKHTHGAHDTTPLIGEERRRSSGRRRRSSTLEATVTENNSVFLNYILPVLFVCGAGVFGYYISGSQSHSDVPAPEPSPHDKIAMGPQVMGYLSAALYLGARIPQIWQNYKKKSVHGLSLLFFIFSVFGNLTYGAQILLYRSDSEYVLLNLSWLLGSIGTIFQDGFIFMQFYMYREDSKEAVIEE
ncbi:hypothetical protein BABINDRAFT_162629 [Babjeviella inositovora NRRL Y-12698]|uniref:Uncharacterized protein n=1 Tax=Babjeviella inositovora NRRL Y-12698 TaxID=984486 RepID=A0A1E3QMS6_9ASCO|nr:uncharacterized protein BABINDRAFT_162629 [Babjeviella inositovora NRRL Y-12698]ODQ78392.1 hypothetical protein BABINDRAFT_162629 [Babjeviella inositovora NRRL Y-12698]